MNSRSSLWIAGLVIVVLAGAVFFFSPKTSAGAPEAKRHVRWLISHQPTDVFARSIEVFRKELETRTDGRLTLDVVKPDEVGYGAVGDIPNADVLEMLKKGDVELATTYTAALGADDSALWSINLPFLFADYTQAGKVLDGKGGQDLLLTVASHTDTHALAFTMSGGFRILASKVPLTSLSDIKGKHIATSAGPVAEATLRALGAVPVSTNIETAGSEPDLSSIDAIETTYSRLSQVADGQSAYTQHIAQTYHSMFLTVILASDSFYESLSAEDAQALQEAALAAAQVEREDSIALGESTKEKLINSGASIWVPSAADISSAKESTRSVYAEYERQHGGDWATQLAQ